MVLNTLCISQLKYVTYQGALRIRSIQLGYAWAKDLVRSDHCRSGSRNIPTLWPFCLGGKKA